MRILYSNKNILNNIELEAKSIAGIGLHTLYKYNIRYYIYSMVEP